MLAASKPNHRPAHLWAYPELLDVGSFHQAFSLLIATRQKDNSRLSLSYFAKKLGLASSATLTNYSKGRRLPSREGVQVMADFFEITLAETQFLQLLADRDRAAVVGDELQVVECEQQLASIRRIAAIQTMKPGHFEIFCSPFHFALRELFRLKYAPQHAQEIQGYLCMDRTVQEIEQAIAVLLEVGMLTRDSTGKIRTQTQAIDAGTGGVSEALRQFHEESLSLAKKAIRRVPLAQRYFGSQVFTVAQTDLTEAKKELESFRRHFALKFESDPGQGQAVYQLNVSLVPLTHGGKRG